MFHFTILIFDPGPNEPREPLPLRARSAHRTGGEGERATDEAGDPRDIQGRQSEHVQQGQAARRAHRLRDVDRGLQEGGQVRRRGSLPDGVQGAVSQPHDNSELTLGICVKFNQMFHYVGQNS